MLEKERFTVQGVDGDVISTVMESDQSGESMGCSAAGR